MANNKQSGSPQTQQLIDFYKQQVDIFELMLDEFAKNPSTVNVFAAPPPAKRIPVLGNLYKAVRKLLIKIKLYQKIKSSHIFNVVAETGVFVRLGR